MSFDLLAPHYRWMEWVLAGRKLHRCRTAFLDSIPSPRRALLLGEGNGRFLIELLRAHPGVQVACVDASARMLECARERAERHGVDFSNVDFIRANLLEWAPPPRSFNLVVTHFFLDCFRADQLAQLLPRISAAAMPGAYWLIADFQKPADGWARWRARLILWTMYLFFRHVTKLPATKLEPPDPWLSSNGFMLRERRLSEWRLLHTDLWSLQPNAPVAKS